MFFGRGRGSRSSIASRVFSIIGSGTRPAVLEALRTRQPTATPSGLRPTWPEASLGGGIFRAVET
jgi:hypothetical protein